MAIPAFDGHGLLPPGAHAATWSQFAERFACNAHRTFIAAKALEALRQLADAGCLRVYVNGSFATADPEPNDIDVLYVAIGIQPRLLDAIWTDRARVEERRMRFGGDFLAVDENDYHPIHPAGLFGLFATDREDRPKGIVKIELCSLPALGVQ